MADHHVAAGPRSLRYLYPPDITDLFTAFEFEPLDLKLSSLANPRNPSPRFLQDMATEKATAAVAAPAKAKKPSAPKKARSAPAHPTYLEMIGEAISSLKERTGSSQYAIAKFIEDKRKAQLPPNFKKLLLVQLRKLTAGGKLTKIKNSYKLTSAPKKPAAAAVAKPKAPVAAKPKAKPAAAAAKTKATKVKSPVKKAAKPKSRPSAKAAPVPAKKAAAAPKRKAAAAAAKPKVKSVKKVGKSPAKKAPAAKKARK